MKKEFIVVLALLGIFASVLYGCSNASSESNSNVESIDFDSVVIDTYSGAQESEYIEPEKKKSVGYELVRTGTFIKNINKIRMTDINDPHIENLIEVDADRSSGHIATDTGSLEYYNQLLSWNYNSLEDSGSVLYVEKYDSEKFNCRENTSFTVNYSYNKEKAYISVTDELWGCTINVAETALCVFSDESSKILPPEKLVFGVNGQEDVEEWDDGWCFDEATVDEIKYETMFYLGGPYTMILMITIDNPDNLNYSGENLTDLRSVK